MRTAWTKNLDVQNTKDITQLYKESLILRKRLNTILSELIEDKRRGAGLESKYDSPNWAYLQADRLGYERALRDIIALISE